MEKREYVAPEIWVDVIQLEDGICAGSAVTRPKEGAIKQEWEQAPDVEKEFHRDWNE